MCLGCAFAMLAATFPRLGILIMLLFTNWIQRAFDGWVAPLLGFIFLPFATIMYVLVALSNPIGDIPFGGWLLIILGVVIDISHWSQIAANRQNGVAMYNQYSPTASKAA
jgi:hypothetical protein